MTIIQRTKCLAIDSKGGRRSIDSDVAREIKIANPNNEMSRRIARDSQRRSATVRKTQASHDAADLAKDLRLQIEEAAARTKALKVQLKATKGTSGRRKSDSSTILSASSSGRVRTAPAKTTRRRRSHPGTAAEEGEEEGVI
ncbi:hypothetical protein K438DRAFT_1778482 [Mycena galopus ATCC 62051]|nr:hypothetical protein K438DRAFT_1778482 [Mycena galopus ATCC 62051]